MTFREQSTKQVYRRSARGSNVYLVISEVRRKAKRDWGRGFSVRIYKRWNCGSAIVGWDRHLPEIRLAEPLLRLIDRTRTRGRVLRLKSMVCTDLLMANCR